MARVLVPLADGFEEMEGIIIIDVLRRAGLEVIVAGLQSGEIRAARGTKHIPDTELAAIADQEFDMVVLPGGREGALNLAKDSRLQAILLRMNEKKKYIGAICAAPNILRNLKIIDSADRFTAHPSTINDGKGGIYINKERIVRSDNITTSLGPGSAFEFALDLVEQLCGKQKRDAIAEPLYLPG